MRRIQKEAEACSVVVVDSTVLQMPAVQYPSLLPVAQVEEGPIPMQVAQEGQEACFPNAMALRLHCRRVLVEAA